MAPQIVPGRASHRLATMISHYLDDEPVPCTVNRFPDGELRPESRRSAATMSTSCSPRSFPIARPGHARSRGAPRRAGHGARGPAHSPARGTPGRHRRRRRRRPGGCTGSRQCCRLPLAPSRPPLGGDARERARRSSSGTTTRRGPAAARRDRGAAPVLPAGAAGPWRWGDPEVGDGPDSDPVPRHELWPPPPDRRPNPLEEPPPLGHRDPFGPSPSESPPLHPGVHPPHSHPLDPEVAEPLAALLDVLAEHLERDDEVVDPRTRITAVSLARSVLHSAPGRT